jgi:hypothetical protein
MITVVCNTKFLFDDRANAGLRPDVTQEAIRFGTFGQQGWQLGALRR